LTKSLRYSAPLHQFSHNDHALVLVCAFVDLADFGVAVEAFDFEAADVTRATEDLHDISRALHGHVAGKALGDRAGFGCILAVFKFMGGGEDETARGFDVFCHVGKQPLHARHISARFWFSDAVGHFFAHGENVWQKFLQVRRSVPHEQSANQLNKTALVCHAGMG
jgi:hypothetical protein